MPRGVPCEFTQLEQDVIVHAVALGWSERTIAEYLGKPRSNVRRYLARLRAEPIEPEDLEISLPVNVLKPERQCTPGHVQEGDPVYCTDCDKTGCEKHPRLHVDHRIAPRPEPKVEPEPKPKPTRKERRKAKRQAVA